MKPSEYPEQMMKTLVRLWEAQDGAKLRTEGALGTDLAFSSGILSSGKSKPEDYSRDDKDEICVAVKELVARGFVTTLD
ncbi:MAG: hypothetical protein AAGB97_04185 [Dehalococcoidia bacterium]|nr:hypothetical protein [Chloroflexota bacterium]MBT9159193.1 hypothetical protein [Chloroflexota bacterium]MBT9161875.1 hypothetical protein [Chloroflexota bacterium]